MPETVAQRVAETLRQEILTGRYRAGDRLRSERDLAEQLGANRGAVREGLRALAQQGLIEISPGGARVGRLDQASLDVVGQLLDLQEIPDATLVDQVLEVSSHLLEVCARIAVERGSDAELDRVRDHLSAFQGDALDPASFLAQLHGLVDGLVAASGNFVLRMVSRSLQLQFWDRLESLQDVTLRLPQEMLAPLAAKIDAALQARDAREASELIAQLMTEHRARVVKLLTVEQARQLRGPVTSHLAHLLEAASDAGEAS